MFLRKCVAGLGLVACLSTMVFSTAMADRVVKFYNISVSGLRAEDTGSALKYHNGQTDKYGGFRISLDSSSNSASTKVQAIMHNSNHESRGSGYVSLGKTAQIGNSGTKGYNYHLNLKYTNTWGGSGVITGYWSPDAPH